MLRSSYRWLAALSCLAALVSAVLGWMPGAQLTAESRETLPVLALALAPFTLLQGVCSAWSGLLAAQGAYSVGSLAPIAQPLGIALGVVLSPILRFGRWPSAFSAVACCRRRGLRGP